MLLMLLHQKKRAKTARCALVPPYGPLFLWTWQPSSKPHKVCDVVCRWMEIRPNAATGFVSLNGRITFDVLHYDVLIDQRRPYATQPSHQVRGDTRHFDMLRRRMPSNTWHSLICGLSLSLSHSLVRLFKPVVTCDLTIEHMHAHLTSMGRCTYFRTSYYSMWSFFSTCAKGLFKIERWATYNEITKWIRVKTGNDRYLII